MIRFLRTSATPRAFARHLPLALLMAVVAALHSLMFAFEPETRMFAEEPHYNQYAFLDAMAEDTSLLPGKLRFDQRPELISRVLAQFVTADDLDGMTLERARRGSELRHRVRYLNLGLLLALLVVVYCQVEELGHGPRTALGAAALAGLFPWFGFYVHTLWPEILHALLVGVTFL